MLVCFCTQTFKQESCRFMRKWDRLLIKNLKTARSEEGVWGFGFAELGRE